MSDVSGWITFREVVDSVQLATEGTDNGQWMRKLNFAIKGYEDLRLFQLPATKPVTLAITGEMRVVVLPEDFLKFVSIGTMYNGKFYPFLPNSEMPTATSGDCGIDSRLLPTQGDPNAVIRFKGYYMLDIENRRIVIDAPITITEVVLNYTPSGIKRDGETYIPRMCREVIEAYVEYMCVLRDKSNAFDKQLFEREYIKAHNKFRGLQYNTDELFNDYYRHLETGRMY